MLLLNTFFMLNQPRTSDGLPPNVLEQLSHTHITTDDVAQAEAKKNAAYRQFFFDIPKENIAGTQARYTEFLVLCRSALGKQTQTSLLPIAFDYLGEQGAQHACFELLSFSLNKQENALSIAPLGRNFIDNPVCFMAFLRWLSTRGVSTDEVLSTHILQDYVRYYLTSFHEANNPITSLHHALQHHADTLELSLAMETTRCPENELSSYTLHGAICTTEELSNPPKCKPNVHITAKIENTTALKHLFGTRFLIYVLQHQKQLELLKHLLLHDFLQCLDTLKQNAASAFDLISNLMPLFVFFSKENTDHACLIFKSLITALFESPDLLEDDSILRALRRFKPAQTILKNMLRDIEKAFEQQCQHEPFDIIDLEDFWYQALNKLYVIQTISSSMQTTLPTDKYRVYGHVAQIHLQKHGVWFNLNNFIRTLHIEPTYDQTAITPYERLLIELLITLDTPHLRMQIIQELLTAIKPPRHFKNTAYADAPLIQHAVEHGNLGLIEWLKKNHVSPSKAQLNTLSILAARFEHWHVVEYLQAHYALQQVTVNTLLHAAVTQQAHTIIPKLFQPNKRHPHIKNIEQAFSKAILLESTAVMHALLSCPTPPCDTILTKGFKQALNLSPRQFSIATRIAESVGYHPCLTQAIHQTFLDAARHNQVSILLCLKHLKTDALTQTTVDTALIRAVQARHLEAAQCIYDFKRIKPRTAAIKTALQHAKKIEHPGLMALLSQSTASTLTPHHKKQKGRAKSNRPLNASPIPMLRTASLDNFGDSSPLLKNSVLRSPSKPAEQKREKPAPTQHQRTQST